MYYVYILRTSSNTLYIGQTNNLEKRLKEHKEKKAKSAKYLRYFSSFQLVYSETYNSRAEALKREYQLKQWPKAKKEALLVSQGGQCLPCPKSQRFLSLKKNNHQFRKILKILCTVPG
ncbi:GIY-YIG nuclease family protein [Candidatus Daviesbacteria bacterium]|nr:GIY-YIG nuclease family protein [Candidatus Daviesbacteria bacterium]